MIRLPAPGICDRVGHRLKALFEVVARFQFVQWRIMLNTRQQEKAERLVGRVSDALGVAIEALEMEPYWKDRDTTEARFRTGLNVDSPADAVFALLLQASRVSSGWQTSGPQSYEGDLWEFEALSASGSLVTGVTWMLCRTANFENT